MRGAGHPRAHHSHTNPPSEATHAWCGWHGVSQPLLATPSQSAHPTSHEPTTHRPLAHPGSPFGTASEHRCPQAPQLFGSVAMLVSQPSS